MAAILSPYSNVGFYNTPISKCLLGGMFIASCGLHVPQFAPFRKHFLCSVADIFVKKEAWKLVSCRLAFLDLKDVMCGALLLYYFRVFERRYGSNKFASFLVATTVMSLLLEALALGGLHHFEIDLFSGTAGYLSSGPYCLIFPLFVNYLFDIPRVAHTHILGVPITGKTLTYLLGLQMAISSSSSAISSTCGIIAGLIWRYNVIKVKKWLKVPKSIAKLTDACLGWLVASSPPQDGFLPMGATLEIQRLQQLEILEQQMLFSRARESRMFGQGHHQLFHNVLNHNNYQDNSGNMRHRHVDANYSDDSDHSGTGRDSREASQPGTSSQESEVQALVEMGFDRQKVLEALRNTGNDMNLATTLLLQES